MIARSASPPARLAALTLAAVLLAAAASAQTTSPYATGLSNPFYIQRLDDGRILVVEQSGNRVSVISDASGNPAARTNFATGLSAPNAILQLADGRVLVAEYGANRVSVISDASGNPVARTDFATGLSAPTALLQLADGRVLVSNRDANRVSVISNASGNPAARTDFVTGLNNAYGLCQLADGRVLVAEYGANRVSVISDASGNPVARTDFVTGLLGPVGLTQVSNLRILVTEYGGGRVSAISLPPPTVSVGTAEGWHLLAAPGDAETFASFLAPVWTQGGSDYDYEGGPPSVYRYKEAVPGAMATGWATTPGFVPFAPGDGATVYLFGDDDLDGADDGFPKALPVYGAEPALPFTWAEAGDAFLGYTDNGSADDGWNLLGNPERSALDWNTVWDEATTNVAATAFGYEPTSGWSSFNADVNAGSGAGPMASGVIPAGTGFFVRATGTSPSLTAPDAPTAVIRAVAQTAAPYVAVHVSAVATGGPLDGHAISGGATAVFVEGGAVGADAYDVPTLAPLGNPAVWVAAVETVGGPGLMQAMLPAAPAGPVEVDLALGLTGVATAAEVTWTAALPTGWRAFLVDRQSGAEVEMIEGSRYAVDLTGADIVNGHPTAGRLAVRVVPTGSTAGEAGVSEAEVSLARPNPTRGAATLRLAVPTAERVRVSIIDALGREVAVALDGVVSGVRDVALGSERLAPGAYVVRAVGASFAESRSLTVVR